MELKRASFMRRFAAWVMDSIILNVLANVVGFTIGFTFAVLGFDKDLMMVLSFISGFVVAWLYAINLQLSTNGQTLGKKMMGIRVQRIDNKQLTVGCLFIREFIGKLLSGLIVMIGYLIALGDERRALHDRIADTIVVKD